MSIRWFAAIGAGALMVLALAGAGLAENYQYKLTAADNAIARSVVLKRSDLRLGPTWKGGASKPDESAAPYCQSLHPRETDLVVTGDATTIYRHGTVAIETRAQVFKSATMVETDWRRSPTQKIIECGREIFSKGLAKGERLVSVARLPFPNVGSHSYAVRVTLAFTSPHRQWAMDAIVFSRGRTEVTVLVSGTITGATDLRILRFFDLAVSGIVSGRTRDG